MQICKSKYLWFRLTKALFQGTINKLNEDQIFVLNRMHSVEDFFRFFRLYMFVRSVEK